MGYFDSGGVPAAVLPGVSRSAGLVWPPLDAPGCVTGAPLKIAPDAASLPVLARSDGGTEGGEMFGTGAGVQTCCAAAGVVMRARASIRRMVELRFTANVAWRA